MGYDTQFTSENKYLLDKMNLSNRVLINKSGDGVQEDISWTQASRNLLGNTEKYYITDYYVEGESKDSVVKVFVAASCGKPPSRINTSGHSMGGGKLHFGYIFYDNNGKAIFFVLHPNSWGPYQNRFRTNAMMSFIKSTGCQMSSMGASAAAGAFVGSVFPGVGTAVGAGVGAAAGWVASTITPSYVGDYLRYIG